MPELSREDVRNAVPCPICKAMVGEKCVHFSKKSTTKNAAGVNHHARQKEAHRFFKQQRRFVRRWL